MQKVYFVSLGCPRNLVDSELMVSSIRKNGYELTAECAKADYIIVNTCGFLQSARKEAEEIFKEMFAEKKSKAKVIATGCMVQLFSDQLKESFPDIHCFLGSGDIDKILQAIEGPKQSLISQRRSYLERDLLRDDLITPSHYAYLKIAEGCQKSCAYCLIPKIKGPLKSKTIEQVEKEFDVLLKRGVFEIILIAQDLTDFGKDRKEKNALEKLLQKLLLRKENFWLRLLYVYPDDISDELIDIMRKDPRVCRYLDMPLQHINDDILFKMKRKVTKTKILHTIDRLRKAMSDIAIRTSFIVGFPQENEKQFLELKSFIKSAKLSQVGIFPYSQEPYTPASQLQGQVSEKCKQKRYQELADLQTEIVKKNNKRWIGKTIDVLVDGYHPESDLLLLSHSQFQCPEIDNNIILNDIDAVSTIGQKLSVEITDCIDIDLLASVIKK